MANQSKAVKNQEKTVWRCKAENCGYSRPPTLTGYKQLVGHQKEHADLKKEERGYHLVNENTGEILADSVRQAKEKGFLQTVPEPPEEKTAEEPPEEKTAEEPSEEKATEEPSAEKIEFKEVLEPQVSSEGFFRYTITLPADAFALFNMAKAAGLEKKDISFDVWLWDCIRKRFDKDYGFRVVLAKIGEA